MFEREGPQKSAAESEAIGVSHELEDERVEYAVVERHVLLEIDLYLDLIKF